MSRRRASARASRTPAPLTCRRKTLQVFKQNFSVQTTKYPFPNRKQRMEARSRRTSLKKLSELALHEDPFVRSLVRDNPRTPLEVRAMLALEEIPAADLDPLSFINQMDGVKLLVQMQIDGVLARDIS